MEVVIVYLAAIIGSGAFLIFGPRLSPAALMIFIIALVAAWASFLVYMVPD